MSRCCVIDTSCAEFDEVVAGGHRGELLGEFRTLDSAIAMVEHKLAQGCRSVVIVEGETARQIDLCGSNEGPSDEEPLSHTRAVNGEPAPAKPPRAKSEG